MSASDVAVGGTKVSGRPLYTPSTSPLQDVGVFALVCLLHFFFPAFFPSRRCLGDFPKAGVTKNAELMMRNTDASRRS